MRGSSAMATPPRDLVALTAAGERRLRPPLQVAVERQLHVPPGDGGGLPPLPGRDPPAGLVLLDGQRARLAGQHVLVGRLHALEPAAVGAGEADHVCGQLPTRVDALRGRQQTHARQVHVHDPVGHVPVDGPGHVAERSGPHHALEGDLQGFAQCLGQRRGRGDLVLHVFRVHVHVAGVDVVGERDAVPVQHLPAGRGQVDGARPLAHRLLAVLRRVQALQLDEPDPEQAEQHGQPDRDGPQPAVGEPHGPSPPSGRVPRRRFGRRARVPHRGAPGGAQSSGTGPREPG